MQSDDNFTRLRKKYIDYFQLKININALFDRAFLAAAVWGGQQGGHICIWEPRIPDDIVP